MSLSRNIFRRYHVFLLLTSDSQYWVGYNDFFWRVIDPQTRMLSLLPDGEKVFDF